MPVCYSLSLGGEGQGEGERSGITEVHGENQRMQYNRNVLHWERRVGPNWQIGRYDDSRGRSRKKAGNRLVPIFRYFDPQSTWVMFSGVTRACFNMKTATGLARFGDGRPTQRRVMSLVLGLAAIMLASGCTKKSTPPVTTAAPPPTNETASAPATPEAPAAPVAAAPVAAPESPAPAAGAEGGPPPPPVYDTTAPTDLPSLNRALHVWIMNNRRRPKDFQDFASSAGVKIPPPPAGKKYTLNGKGFIILVDN